MIHEPSMLAVVVFLFFVGITLGLSFYLGRKAKSAEGYFAAHGQIPWFVNGVAFAGDYLSAASFLGICGMIAFYGYDGFLYSIGFLAGWIVALFVVAEPMKRLGKYTFADALDAKFNSRGVKLVAGISTLVVSVFYLIPQMVGAGVLIQPLLGFEHWHGVVIVGVVVILIVTMAGMVSTTWVQFIKGSLLVVFSLVLTVMILNRGFKVDSDATNSMIGIPEDEAGEWVSKKDKFRNDVVIPSDGEWTEKPFVRTRDEITGRITAWHKTELEDGNIALRESQLVEKRTNEAGLPVVFVNGLKQNSDPKSADNTPMDLFPVGSISHREGEAETGPLGPIEFFKEFGDSQVVLWPKETIKNEDGSAATVYYPKTTHGEELLRPGVHPKFKGIRSNKWSDKLNFLSLMLALFCGTASLPHILIRYYTVKDGAAARKSTIVGIATIGFFYVLTLYIGLGAMTSGALDVTSSNLAAPLLAKSFGDWLFAIISAIAFTTVLGTVSGLILASSGAVAHDLAKNVMNIKMTDEQQVRLAKLSSVVIGAIAIILGILFKDMNVSFLVGWAFSVAASANLPALIMILFWKRTTAAGVISAVTIGVISSLTWILLSGSTFKQVYGIDDAVGYVPFGQPGIVTIPLGFVTLIVVSLLTQKEK